MHKLAACLLLFLVTSCSRQIRGPVVPRILSNPIYTEAQFSLDLHSYRESSHIPGTGEIIRNRVIYGLMADIEYSYRTYEGNLFIDSGKFNVGSDILELGLATAGTLAGANYTKTLLSTILSASAGARLSVGKNFFREKAVEAVINGMQSRRNRVESIILAQLAKPVKEYPLEMGIKDVREFFFAGTLEGGLTEMSQQSAATAHTDQIILDKLKTTR